MEGKRSTGMLRKASVVVVAAVAAVSACGDHHGESTHHAMEFEIQAGLRLPVVYGGLEDDGATLTLSTVMKMGGMNHDLADAFEVLHEGYEYRVWGGAGGQWIDLGKFEAGTDFSAAADGVEELRITMEPTTGATVPSDLVVVSGKIGETLSFGTLTVTSFTPAALTAHIQGESLELEYAGLPELPAGYEYELWVVPADEEGAASAEPISLAVMEGAGDGDLPVPQVAWPENFFLVVSIESQHGVPGRSALAVYLAQHEHEATSNEHGH
jgi:hypothetical protein